MRALVTGSSGGIGAAFVAVLAAAGHEVVATARRPDTIAHLPAVEHLALDVTDDDSVRDAVGRAGPLDLLINNAGISVHGPVERMPLAEYQRVMDTNLWGTVRMVQAVVPSMRERGGGSIVNVSSVAGRVAPPLDSAYSASKWALEGVTEALHFELSHFGIRVMLVEPGYIAPGMKDMPTHGEEAPYDELRRQYGAVDEKVLDGPRPSPEVVPEAVLAALDSGDPPLRLPVGLDAEMILGLRDSVSDAEFEAAMRATLGLTW